MLYKTILIKSINGDKWCMELNCKKCKMMLFGNSQVTRKFDHVFTMRNGESRHNLEISEVERDLGVKVESDMKWKYQTQMCVNKASRILGMLKNTFECRDRKLWTTLYTTYVRPHLEFAVSVWNPPNATQSIMLEKVQRRASKIPNTSRTLKYNERLNKMSITTLDLRRRRGDLIQFYKSLNGLERIEWYQKPNLKTNAIQDVPAASTRVNQRRVRSQSFTSREINDFHSSVSARMHFFTNRAASMWNKLPDKVANARSLNAFKAELDDWLRYDENKEKFA
jgi:ribonuclease P/MRP protein subunit RPP40